MPSHRPLVRLALPVLAVLAVAVPARAADVDKYLPDDTQFVVTVNVKELLATPAVKQNALPQLKALLQANGDVSDTLKDLGFDPLADLDSVQAAGPGGGEPDKVLVIVHGRFDLDKFRKAAAAAEKDHGDVFTIHKVNDGKGGQFQLYEVNLPEQNTPIFVSLPNNKTVLVSLGKDFVVDALRKEFRNEKPALKDSDFQTLLERQDPKHHVSFAAGGTALANANLPADVAAALRNLDGLGGGVTVGDDIKLEVVGLAKNAQGARELGKTVNDGVTQGVLLLGLAAMANPDLQPLLDVVKSVRCSVRDKTVTVKAEVSKEVLEGLLKDK